MRADRLDQDVDQEPQLALDGGAGYVWRGGETLAEPIGPLCDHFVPQVGHGTADGQQRRVRSAQCHVSLECRAGGNLHAEPEWGQRT